MKKLVIAVAGVVGIVTSQGLAAEMIDSKVIHDYNYIGGGFGYLHDIGDSGIDAYGPFGEASFEQYNVVLHAVGGYFWGDEAELRTWNVAGSVGYVVRLLENHVNIIPRFGGGYSHARIEFDGTEFSGESWVLLPGVTVSYALNNRLAVNGGYTYVYDVDTHDHNHTFTAGAQFALLERVGLNVTGLFSRDTGFDGITTGIELHF